jgi:hypothetical protein
MDKLRFLMSGLWVFLQPFIRVLLTQGGTLLIQASMQAVTAVAMDMKDAPGAEKRSVAFDMIRKQLIDKGIDLATVEINAALEAAVLKLQKQ